MIQDSIKITYGKWEAQINPRLGANIISLKEDGKDILRPLEDEAALQINPYLYGAPILAPANRTYLGKFTFEGVEYTLPINEAKNNCNLHGSVLYQPFEVLSSDESSVKLMLTDKECGCYPFPFSLTVSYKLCEEGCVSEFEFKNEGDGNMPLTFALHTTFVEPESFTLPVNEKQERDNHCIPTGRYIPLSEQEEGYVVGSPSRGLRVDGYFHSAGKVAKVGDYTYTVSENFDHWVLFNGGGVRGFLCLEPQAGRSNGLNYADGHMVVAPKESAFFRTVISKD